tara:strand:- start:4308 stop:5768 length:1461 start_codon:yes stop_codon:yes gene_type:complete
MSDSFKIFNSLGKKKEVFYTNKKNQVSMYVCGPTVYDLLHVGNFRGPIFFNFFRNLLEHKGYKVNYVYNYTDIDDKIINRSIEQNISTSELAEKYIAEFEKDYKSLKIQKPSSTPRCTDHIDDILDFIQDLISKDFAYESSGSVFFSIEKFKEYGKLSGKNTEDLLAGYRVNVNDDKKNPLDFVLWKPSSGNDPGWPSPWGYGRPGWHIECSAMSSKLLGSKIDIHGGGVDLLFPHHENEIAQSECRSSTCFSNFWVHNNLINFDNQKMSKSLGNIIKGRDFINDYNSEVFKFLILSVHYRSILNFNQTIINQSIGNLIKIYSALRLADNIKSSNIDSMQSELYKKEFKAFNDKIEKFLDNDLNTPGVFGVFFDIVRKFNLISVNKKITGESKYFAENFLKLFNTYGDILGLFQESKQDFVKELNILMLRSKSIDLSSIEEKILIRNKARTSKNYELSDKLRDELLIEGIELKDNPDGSTDWSVKI